jgi:glutaredoxin
MNHDKRWVMRNTRNCHRKKLIQGGCAAEIATCVPAPFDYIPREPTDTMSESTPKITAYLKTFCGWSEGVRAVMRKYNLPFEEKDIIKNPAFRWEMETKSGQSLSPCVEINGQMLADISGAEVETWMLENGLVEAVDAEADAPTNSACSDEQHAAMAKAQLPPVSKIKFFS